MIKLLGFLKPVKKYVIITVIVMLLSQGVGLLLPLLMSNIMNYGIQKNDIQYIKNTGALMVIAATVSVALAILNSYFTSKLSTDYGKILRQKVFFKVEGLAQCDIDKIGTASIITRSTNDVKQMQDFVLVLVRMILSAPIMLIGGTVMAFVMNARLAMYVFAVLPIIAGIVAIVLKFVMPLFKKRQKLTDRLNHLVREKLSGIRVIRAFNRSEFEDERFDERNGELADIALKIARIFAVLIPSAIVLAFSCISLLIWVAAKNIDSMDYITDAVKIQNTVGDLQAFLIYMIMIVASLTMAAAMFVIVPRATISANRILELLELETELVPAQTPVKPDDKSEIAVEFDDVSFGYPGAEETVLSHISFTAKKGETTAVIGGTGSGKSTIVNLIPRFYDATYGQVLIDGVNVKNISEDDLCAKIGFIPQTAFLFSGTVEENIRYGKEDATEEEIWKALEIAQAADFVRELPEGLDSHVSQGGTNFSGGQKQRLSIARAIVKKAEIYVFDDSFSALDFKTDAALRKAIAENIKDAAIVVVAQRVGTILGAEKIIVIDEGRIAGAGTHNQLLQECSVYREIVESQLAPDEINARR